MTRRNMAHKGIPLARHPDDGFLWADDMTRLSWIEVARFALASLVLGCGLFTLAFLLAVV
jgi:hypothetical protein